MGQYDVLKWLRHKRFSHIDDFFTLKQIYHGMQKDGIGYSFVSIWNSVTKLKEQELLETTGKYPISFRSKSKQLLT